jgi:hypothetical protein
MPGKINIKSVKLTKLNTQHKCVSCGNEFIGKACNICGEKVFDPSHLSIKNFAKQAVDIFTHFENKVLKSIWLNIAKPGFITKENLRGVRVKYAKPLQLFIVVNIFFYLVVTHFSRTDYTPSIGDYNSYNLSYYPYLKWAKPYDEFIAHRLQKLNEKKFTDFTNDSVMRRERIFKQMTDSTVKGTSTLNEALYINTYKNKVALYSKTLIFLVIPVFALIFYVLFFKKLNHFGGALILATHFLSFNLLLHSLLQLISFAPLKWFGSTTFSSLPYKAVSLGLYNEWLAPFSHIFFGLYKGFEAIHIIFFTLWLFIAFKRLFNFHWLLNFVLSYLSARIFFIIIFTFYKKFLIAFTLWNM